MSNLFQDLHYDPETGNFTWKRAGNNRISVGQTAGHLNLCGYIKITIGRRQYAAHRLAWLAIYGTWPNKLIDHINGDRSDNRIVNLRLATAAQNIQNARSYARKTPNGLKGTSYDPRSGKWYAVVTVDKRRLHLGTFATSEDANAAYCAAAKQHFGQFFNAGKAT